MTTGEFLQRATKTLEQAGIASARLDVLVLLENALRQSRALILAHLEATIASSIELELNNKIAQRAKHVPLAYLRGRAEFYGREFMITDDVLVPRPETETMIDLLKKLPLPAKSIIADIGTGTGCIGITASLELPSSKVYLYDIDDNALKLAVKNAKELHAQVICDKSDLLKNTVDADVLLANLPYVPERYAINRAAEHEPKHAIFGGKDGLNLYRLFWEQTAALSKKPRFILTESLPPQQADLAALANAAGYHTLQTEDFIQVFEKR